MKNQDQARSKTNNRLKQLESEISRVYSTDSALQLVQKEYQEYMDYVEKETRDLYQAYQDDKTPENKKAYTDAVRKYTLDSKKYQSIVNKLVTVMTVVNQKALNVSNNAMAEIYAVNYNQVAVDCKKAGIKVNGKK